MYCPSAIGVTVHARPTWPSLQAEPHRMSTGAEGVWVSASLLLVILKVMGEVTWTSSSSAPKVISGGRLWTMMEEKVDAWSFSPSETTSVTANSPSSFQLHS